MCFNLHLCGKQPIGLKGEFVAKKAAFLKFEKTMRCREDKKQGVIGHQIWIPEHHFYAWSLALRSDKKI